MGRRQNLARPEKRLFTAEQIAEVRREYAVGQMHRREHLKRSIAALAARYGVSTSAMYDILQERCYKEIPS